MIRRQPFGVLHFGGGRTVSRILEAVDGDDLASL